MSQIVREAEMAKIREVSIGGGIEKSVIKAEIITMIDMRRANITDQKDAPHHIDVLVGMIAGIVGIGRIRRTETIMTEVIVIVTEKMTGEMAGEMAKEMKEDMIIGLRKEIEMNIIVEVAETHILTTPHMIGTTASGLEDNK